MLTLTESAAGKVKELLVEEGREDIALRVAVQPGGCSGLRYSMYLDDQVTDKDQTAEQHGVRLVVDKMSVPYLTQATVDFVDTLEQSGFMLRTPTAHIWQGERDLTVLTEGLDETDTRIAQLDLTSGYAIQHLAHDLSALTHLCHAGQIALIAVASCAHGYFELEFVIEQVGFRSSEIKTNTGSTQIWPR
jgi:iron-sulfur cluster assembly accessory protein